MALHSLYCADVPLRNCSLTHSLTYWLAVCIKNILGFRGAFSSTGRESDDVVWYDEAETVDGWPAKWFIKQHITQLTGTWRSSTPRPRWQSDPSDFGNYTLGISCSWKLRL